MSASVFKTPTAEEFRKCVEQETVNLTTLIDVSKLTVEDATNLTLVDVFELTMIDVSKLTLADVTKLTVEDIFKLKKAINHCAAPQKRFVSKVESEYQACLEQETSEWNISNTLADHSKLMKAMADCAGQARIIGGQQIAYREYPWIVSTFFFY